MSLSGKVIVPCLGAWVDTFAGLAGHILATPVPAFRRPNPPSDVAAAQPSSDQARLSGSCSGTTWRSGAQVAPGPPLQARCARIVPALPPAAELMLRGVMDLRHAHWQEQVAALPDISVRDAVEEARRPCPVIPWKSPHAGPTRSLVM